MPVIAIYGDHIVRVVTWNQGTDLSSLKGTPVKLRFVMSDTDLFALKFGHNPRPKARVAQSGTGL